MSMKRDMNIAPAIANDRVSAVVAVVVGVLNAVAL